MWALYEVKVIILTIIGLPPEPEMGEFLFTYAMRKQDPLLFRAWERSFYWQRYTWSTTSFILLMVEGSKLSEKHFSVTIVSTSTHQPDFGNTIIKVRSLIYITIFFVRFVWHRSNYYSWLSEHEISWKLWTEPVAKFTLLHRIGLYCIFCGKLPKNWKKRYERVLLITRNRLFFFIFVSNRK